MVSIEGRVVSSVREDSQDEYVLISGDRLLTAIYRHPRPPAPPPPMRDVPLGSTIRVTGICILTGSDPWYGEVPFNILLRSFDDVELIARPSLLTVDNLLIVVAMLLAAMLIVGARGWMLGRRMRRQTAAVAYLERRRRSILEDINGSRPLVEIIDQITEMVSSELNGAPCWCQIVDGAQVGNRPPDLKGLRVIEDKIPSRSGAKLGTVSAAFAALSKPRPEEYEALSTGAGLAAVAVETRRLYSDLLHRSEFDLLTEIQNRFSLEKRIDETIRTAREKAGIFGLIYIDLDKFKQVNDHYGHLVGDEYLQEVAARLKRQLRPGDLLARLGGDEFAVLVPAIHNRADADEISSRLQRCFDEPFAIETETWQGSASFGVALYPEDATTKDGLLSAADAAMYVMKNARSAATMDETEKAHR